MAMSINSLPRATCHAGHDAYVSTETLGRISSLSTSLNQNTRHFSWSRAGPRSFAPSSVVDTKAISFLGRSLQRNRSVLSADHHIEEANRTAYYCPLLERRPQVCCLLSGDGISICNSSVICLPAQSGSRSEDDTRVFAPRLNPLPMMSKPGRTRAGEDTDLRCVEVSAIGAPTSLAKGTSNEHWIEPGIPQCGSSQEQTAEEFLSALLLKTDSYRTRPSSLVHMANRRFLNIRAAVVKWFANVSESYKFANETTLAAISNFDRYVGVRLEAMDSHLFLQLVAYVALLVASKMSETTPLRMKSLAGLTGRMFKPCQVKKCEMDMLSKLQYRLAPPSADETLLCLTTLVQKSWPSGVFVEDVQSMGSYYLKKARVRNCWVCHSAYTLAVAALATAYKSLGLGQLRRRLIRECDARARGVIGRGVDVCCVAICANAMASEEHILAARAAAGSRWGTESPALTNNDTKGGGWGSPTGVAQGAQTLLQEVAFSTMAVAAHPIVALAPSVPRPVDPYTFPGPARAQGLPVSTLSTVVPTVSRVPAPALAPDQQQCGKKRGLPQSSSSCFEPRRRLTSVCGVVGRSTNLVDAPAVRGASAFGGGGRDCVQCVNWNQQA